MLTADGSSRVYDIGDIYSQASSYNTRVLVNSVLQTEGVDYTYDNNTQSLTFAAPPFFGAEILVVSGRIVLSVKNQQSALVLDKITVLPGTGTVFNDLGFDTFVGQQIITSPSPQDYANFGQALFISDSTTDLVVGAPRASLIGPCTFDSGRTRFDAESTAFADAIVQSGAVYTFDFLPATDASITNPGQFVFGQQIYNNQVAPLTNFGAAVDYTTGVLLIGAPGDDLGDSAANFGSVYQFLNSGLAPAWRILRRQTPVVDISLLNSVFMYDRISSNTKQNLFFSVILKSSTDSRFNSSI